MANMDIEEDALQEDSFEDGQPEQPGEAESRSRGPRTLEDVRNLVGSDVSVDPVDPSLLSEEDRGAHFSPWSRASHQRPLTTLRTSRSQALSSSQPRLVFNPPRVSSRGAGPPQGVPPRNISGQDRGAAPASVVPPRNISEEGRRVNSPAGGQAPDENSGPWFPRHLGEEMFDRIGQLMEMVADRNEGSRRRQEEPSHSRWRSPLRDSSTRRQSSLYN